MKISKLDHLVLTVKSIDESVNFYVNVLGMKRIVFGDNRIALAFGDQKINLHQHKNEFEPKAENVMPGSADLCFIVDIPISEVKKYLIGHNVSLVDGPVYRTGAIGRLLSIYIRDPDSNLIELSNYIQIT